MSAGALDFGGGMGVNATPSYLTFTSPALPDSDWCMAGRFRRTMPGLVGSSQQFLLCIGGSSATPNSAFIAITETGFGNFTWLAYAQSGAAVELINQGSSDGVPNVMDNADYLVLMQRVSNQIEVWFYRMGSQPGAASYSTSTSVAGNTVSSQAGSMVGYGGYGAVRVPLGEFFIFTDRSLNATQIGVLLQGRPITDVANPLIYWPLRDGRYAPSTLKNQGSGGSTYDLTISGSAGDFYPANGFTNVFPAYKPPRPKSRRKHRRSDRSQRTSAGFFKRMVVAAGTFSKWAFPQGAGGGGSTNYPVTLTATAITTSAAIQRQTSVIRTTSAIVSSAVRKAAVSVTRIAPAVTSVPKRVAVVLALRFASSSLSALLVRQTGVIRSSSSASTATGVKTVNVTRAPVAVVSVPKRVAAVNVIRTATQASSAVRVALVGVIRSASSASTATVSAIKTKLITLTATAITTVASRVMQVGAVRAASSASTVTIRRAVNLIRSVSSTSAASIGRSVNVTRSAGSSSTTSILRALGIVRSSSSASAATVTRAVSIKRSTTQASAAAIQKLVGTIRSASSTSTAAVTTVKVKLLTLVATATSTASMIKRAFITRAVTSTSAAIRVVSVQAVRRATQASTASISRQFNKVMSTTSASVATVRKQFIKTLSSAATSTAVRIVLVRRTLRATVTQVATWSKGAQYVILTASVSVVAGISSLFLFGFNPAGLKRIVRSVASVIRTASSKVTGRTASSKPPNRSAK